MVGIGRGERKILGMGRKCLGIGHGASRSRTTQ